MPRQPMKVDKRRVTVYLPVAQAKRLRIQAATADKDISALVSDLLEKAGISREA